jgi:hypothetical protein
MSLNKYADGKGAPCSTAATPAFKSGTPASVKAVERPTSRLSKRMTQKLRAASFSQNSSSHAIICEARPMIKSTGGASGDPNES